MKKLVTADVAAGLVRTNDVVSISSSSGLGCPDKVLAAIGARFEREGQPRNLTTLNPIAAGDMYASRGSITSPSRDCWHGFSLAPTPVGPPLCQFPRSGK